MTFTNQMVEFEKNFYGMMDLYNRSEEYQKDFHIIRFYSALIAISHEKVVDIKGDYLSYCPLANQFYSQFFLKSQNKDQIKDSIKKIVESKIQNLRSFTSRRILEREEISVPFGASELLMYALKKGVIDSAVVVCEGVGSVIVKDPCIVQGIGGRMNGLFFTTPIKELQEILVHKGCEVVFPDAKIDQIRAVEEACLLGYKNIAVTVNGCMVQEKLELLRYLENKHSVKIIILVVCTTGINEKRVQEIKQYSDLVWSCASEEVRTEVGAVSILQISKRIPVFVLRPGGIELITAYAKDSEIIEGINFSKQYVLSNIPNQMEVVLGDDFIYFLHEKNLPIRSKGEPRF